ncbi:hypothetical protein AVEN_155883-1 [Araneus ventricosus]|uniref:Uncharacterized protein n=1 Tax=Araneus ventricosus TaxID=182803 RepID=A0A4Y2NHU9_ARAVE|nr:hypothetical protein AVEN_155883-1 [Araneus ventricosus]
MDFKNFGRQSCEQPEFEVIYPHTLSNRAMWSRVFLKFPFNSNEGQSEAFGIVMFSFPREKSLVPFTSTASQQHLVVIKKTFAKVIAATGERPHCTGINTCQRAHLGRLSGD